MRSAVLCTLAVAGCVDLAAAQADGLLIPPGNQRLDGNIFDFANGLLVTMAIEGDTGIDHNGDGDLEDGVPRVRIMATGETITVPTAAVPGAFLDEQPARWLLARSELSNGFGDGVDYNGDGDLQDSEITAIHDLRTGRTTNLGLPLGTTPEGGFLVGAVWELFQGQADLNGDTDDFDRVAHVYDLARGITTPLGLAVADDDAIAVVGQHLALAVEEFAQGGSDLDGDGDFDDQVLHLFDPATGVVANLGVPVGQTGLSWFGLGWTVASDRLLIWVPEDIGPGMEASILDPITGGVTPTGLVSAFFPRWAEVVGDSIFLAVPDPVTPNDNAWLHRIDVLGALHEDLDLPLGARTATQAGPFGHDDGLATFLVLETDTDLNGDGDTDDHVLHRLVLPDGEVNSLGLAGWAGFVGGVDHHDGIAAVLVPEEQQGGTDFNLDGDAIDLVPGLVHVSSGRTLVLPWASDYVRTGSGLAHFGADEAFQGPGGTDLNGDGDALESVLHVFDLRSGVLTPVGAPTATLPSQGGRSLAFRLSETFTGPTDLNGDGDTNDAVIHVVEF